MGKGCWVDNKNDIMPEYTWEEISKHIGRDDRWIVVDGLVLDVSNWARKHPGGEKIISSFAGQDASEAWYAFHIDKHLVGKYMNALIKGKVRQNNEDSPHNENNLVEDFKQLRNKAETNGLFKPSVRFYIFIMAHILFFDFAGWWVLYEFGTGWPAYIFAASLLTVAQIQAGWAQHDYGHMSVMHNYKFNHAVQLFLLNFIKGASCDWWNFRHLNHHAKPNVLSKDPDITLAPLFLVGNTVASEYGKKKKCYLPYQFQHKYFFFVLPPLLLPLYFNIEIPYFLIKRRRWMELLWIGLFFVKWQLTFGPMLGFLNVFALFLFVRTLESHWFVWATQMSHLPMNVDYDAKNDWVTSQVVASCNIKHSLFNDWWSGHLNFQIEHHLFPTMPRHNLIKVSKEVRSLCDRHGLAYQVKPLFTAFADVVRCLEKSGQTWLTSYNL